ncbi:ribonuclease HII [Ammoniphilus oxalaticus]|uniref:Ribonuclease HII n=1 Tax=Ammoniphilus oxalaticus TaxID=66863 RepID=A0A419SJG2_9BACL|nr:ribonuclease HII [Ammoniphilus oxalaticus]RKD24184.1 ribonuclease HII [Ammoniphilus oxalaticus]
MNSIHTMTIKEIKEFIDNQQLEQQTEQALATDSRVGVRRLLEQYQRRRRRERQLQEQWEQMRIHELELKQRGYAYIAGMDEVGRGPLAGPVVAAAVILPDNFYLIGLNDSKQLAPQVRENFYDVIVEQAIAYTVCFADAQTIDQMNIHQATQQTMRDCIAQLEPRPEICLVDGRPVSQLGVEQRPIVGGDSKSISISAASIIAKVTRDRWMIQAHETYPVYGFAQNMGYGTAEHLNALEKYGPCPLHRKTFGVVKEYA